jgi:hypothetical protein
MDVTLDREESACMQAALRSYCSDLRMEIADTDNPDYRRKLRHEREVLERAIAKLDGAAEATQVATGTDGEPTGMVVRFVGVWTR